MLGFMWMVGTRSYMLVQSAPWNVNNNASTETERASQRSMTISAVFLVFSSLLLMVSIVNRGVASGGGLPGESYGKSVVALVTHYIQLLWQQAIGKTNVDHFSFGPLEGLSIVLASIAVMVGGWSILFEND